MLAFNCAQLFTESLRNGDSSYLRRVKSFMMNSIEQDAVNAALEHEDTHGLLPTIDMFKKHPRLSVMISEEHKETPLAIVGPNALDQMLNRAVRQELRQFDIAVNPRTRIDLDGLMKIVEKARSAMPDETPVTLTDADLDDLFNQADLEKAINFGFAGIDMAAGALLPGEIATLTARTGNGKSLFCCHLATRWIREGKRVMFISCEMPPSQLMHRIFGILGAFNPKLFRLAAARAELNSRMGAVRDELANIKLGGGEILFMKEAVSINAIETAVVKQKPDILIVDGIYLLSVERGDGASADWQRVKLVSNSLKQMALDYHIPIFTTTQLKRTGGEDVFTLEDIAYSDAIAQDGDIIMAISRDPATRHTVNVQVIKNRNGETFGGSRIAFDWDQMTLEEVPLAMRRISLASGADEEADE